MDLYINKQKSINVAYKQREISASCIININNNIPLNVNKKKSIDISINTKQVIETSINTELIQIPILIKPTIISNIFIQQDASKPKKSFDIVVNKIKDMTVSIKQVTILNTLIINKVHSIVAFVDNLIELWKNNYNLNWNNISHMSMKSFSTNNSENNIRITSKALLKNKSTFNHQNNFVQKNHVALKHTSTHVMRTNFISIANQQGVQHVHDIDLDNIHMIDIQTLRQLEYNIS